MERTYRNVNQAFNGLIKEIAEGTIKTRKEETRNGPVLQIDEPAMITYEKPIERVLFNEDRDVNPFFSVYESLWMLAGRNDVESVAYYAANMKNYSDDGETLNGAYGYRWTKAKWCPGYGLAWERSNQLDVIVKHLKEKPNSRRAVLQMWNVEDDLLKIDSSKDVCCNLSVLFSIRQAHGETNDYPGKFLDMTVTNRSNDLVWGMLGANYVHFSFLQEYLAARLGAEVGRYTQFSNNLHVYTENNSGFHPDKWLANGDQDLYTLSAATNMVHVPLVRDPVMFDREVKEFVEMNNGKGCTVASVDFWTEPFFRLVAQPMMTAFYLHKQREYKAALEWVSLIHATDWRIATTNWIKKREMNWKNKQEKAGE